MIRLSILLVGFTLIAATVGCTGGGVKEETIEVKASNDPLAEPRALLKRYSEGQPMTSEVTSFPAMVANVKKSDPARGEILEKGLADIQKAAPAARAAKAREVLQKLQPSMK